MEKAIIYRQVIGVLASKKKDFSLDELASCLKIKKQSLYSYFDSKEQLIKESLDFSSSQLKIISFNVDFSKTLEEVIVSLLKHYVALFSLKDNRDYLSVVYCLKEYSISQILNIEDIKFTIESQLCFILSEYEERKKFKSKFLIQDLAHILTLICFDMISSCDNLDKGEFEIKKIKNLLLSLIEI